MEPSISRTEEQSGVFAGQGGGDAIVCYCHRLTHTDLVEAHKKCGSLAQLEETTRAGRGCGGCRVVLQSLFGGRHSDVVDFDKVASQGTLCVKPGHKVMKGFVVANEHLESSVFSSNCVAPQLGTCDTTTRIEYGLIDHKGTPVLHRHEVVPTNATFRFDTKNEDIPRPFYGMFFLTLDRENVGAARFNIYWRGQNSICSTHENANTGRPRVSVPIIVTEDFLRSCNSLYVALINPHSRANPFALTVHEVDTGEVLTWKTDLGPFGSTWINASEYLFGPAVSKNRKGRFALTVETATLHPQGAITVYFFVHNRRHNTWTSNHL